ncbi:MAG: NADH-quinone oxidoreductase subunit L [Candidatus Margulisbacteria bacterium]|nr:NADH-quinone oxidoreductase subunit L [Candidatus Margulisiibacteriota bacterium]
MNLLPGRFRVRSALLITGAVCIIQIGLVLVHPTGFWDRLIIAQLEPVLGFNLQITWLALVMMAVAGLVSLAALLVAAALWQREFELLNFSSLLLIALIGMNGIAMVNGLFQLYIFIEVTALATFILICLRRDRFAFEGVWKYLLLSVVASVLMLTAVGLSLIFSPSSTFLALRATIPLAAGSFLPRAAIALFLSGLLIKSGVVPFHGWLPDAYQAAPAPVSVLLAGVITKATGVFALIRFVAEVTGPAPVYQVLLLTGALSVVVGALGALGQTDVKRLLAYSSISQVGYIIMALGAGTTFGLIAAMFHFFNHAIFKSQLFANAAALEARAGSTDLNKISGLGGRMPVTSVTLLIGSLSTAGLPPLAGFWSKLAVIMALWLAGQSLYAFIAALASVLTLAYFLFLQRKLFFNKLSPELSGVKEAGPLLLAPAVGLAALTVIIGLALPVYWLLGGR